MIVWKLLIILSVFKVHKKMKKEKHTFYFWIGCCLMIIGIGFFSYTFCKEIDKSLDDFLTGMSDSSQVTAAFVTIAGLFLVLDNLALQRKTLLQQQEEISQGKISIDLQREELKTANTEAKKSNEYFEKQNASFLEQQYHNLFFKLLENHTKLITLLTFKTGQGHSGIDKWYKETLENVNKYKRYHSRIMNLQIAKEYPVYVVRSNEEIFNLMVSSICHLILFIKEKLSDNTFFHQTVYNALTNSEKYFLGYHAYNCRLRDLSLFKTSSFNYLELFEKNKGFFDMEKHHYFPVVEISFKNLNFRVFENSDLIKNSFLTDMFILDFNLIANEKQDIQLAPDLKSVSISYKKHRIDEVTTITEHVEYKDLEYESFDLKGLVYKTLIIDYFANFEIIKSSRNVKQYEFTLAFNCIFLERKIALLTHYNLQFMIDSDSKTSMVLSSRQNQD